MSGGLAGPILEMYSKRDNEYGAIPGREEADAWLLLVRTKAFYERRGGHVYFDFTFSVNTTR